MKKTIFLILLVLSITSVAQNVCYDIPKHSHTMSGHDIGQAFMACTDGDYIKVTTWLATTIATTNTIEFRLFDQNNIIVASQIYNVQLPAWVYPQGGQLQEFLFQMAAPINGGQYYRWELSYCCTYVNTNNNTLNEIICGRTAQSVIYGNAHFTHYNADGTFSFQINQVKDIRAKVEIRLHGCFGDFNGDGEIDNDDAQIIASQYGMPCQNITTDMDGDCDVDDADLFIFKNLLGTPCN